MPPVIAAVGAAAASAAAGTTIFGLSVAASSALIGSANLALGFISSSLTKKPSAPSFQPFASRATNRAQQIRQPIAPQKMVVGETRISGALTFAESSGKNKFIHLVITLANHEIASFRSFYLNDLVIYPEQLDGDGMVTSGRFKDLVRIQTDDGSATTQPFPDLVSETTQWTSTHLQRGHAKIYVRLKFNRNKFPTGIPNISVGMQGLKVEDPRSATTGFSVNPILVTRQYMRRAKINGGVGLEAAEFNDTQTNASANTAEEMVATKSLSHTVFDVDDTGDTLDVSGDVLKLQTGDRVQITTDGTLPSGLSLATNYYVIVKREAANTADSIDCRIALASTFANAVAGTAIDMTDTGSGSHTVTKNAEPRYTCAGTIETEATPFDILTDLRSSFAGRLLPVNGGWLIKAGAYETPTITFTEDDLRGPMTVITRRSRRDRFNAVKGVYVSPLNFGQPSDYPPVTSSAFEVEDDDDQVFTDLDLPYTPRPQAAQRIAAIELQRHRRQIECSIRTTLKGIRAVAAGTCMLTIERYGWTSKVFEVVRWQLVTETVDDVAVLYVDLDLAESDANVFTFDHTADEVIPDPASRSTLPDPFDITAPTSLAVTTETVTADTGAELGYIVLSWAEHPDGFVLDGGSIEAQFKKSADVEWSETWEVPGDRISTRIGPLEKNINYDIQVRAVSVLGVQSTWSALTGFTLGSTGSGATNQLDYNEFSDASTKSIDYGSFGGSVTSSFDYGEFV